MCSQIVINLNFHNPKWIFRNLKSQFHVIECHTGYALAIWQKNVEMSTLIDRRGTKNRRKKVENWKILFIFSSADNRKPTCDVKFLVFHLFDFFSFHLRKCVNVQLLRIDWSNGELMLNWSVHFMFAYCGEMFVFKYHF